MNLITVASIGKFTMAFLSPSAFGADSDFPFDLPRATFGEEVQRRARRASTPNEHEWSTIIPKLMFALQLAVAATVARGAILALFAWTRSG
jgi:hypothetical protein